MTLEGKKTFIGIIVIVLGMIGVGDMVTDQEIGVVIDVVAQIVGVIMAIYGRVKAKKIYTK